MTQTFQSIDPATGAVVWEGPAAGPAEVAAALARARAAFPHWAARPLEERIALVRAYGEQLQARAAELAALRGLGLAELQAATHANACAALPRLALV